MLSGTDSDAMSTMTNDLYARSPTPYWERPRLGELLTRRGYIDKAQLESALEEARATKELLGVVLLRRRYLFEDELAQTLSQQLSLPYINIGQVGVDFAVARLIPAEAAVAAIAIPVRVLGDNSIQVAFGDPTDPQSLEAVRAHLPRTSLAVSEVSAITAAWRRIAGRIASRA